PLGFDQAALSDLMKGSLGSGEMVGSTYSTFDQIRTVLEEQYFSSGELDSGAMIDRALKGYVAALDDPYTVYMDNKENEGFQTTLKGETDFEGIGAYVAKKDNGVMIEEIVKGSPSFKAGLQPLDLIIAIDGTGVDNLDLNQAVEKIRGPKGSTVELTIIREKKEKAAQKDLMKIKVVRDSISIPSVSQKVIESAGKKIGYIAISIIGEETEKLFKESVSELKKQGVGGIILDLRGNGGGFLPIAVEISSHFVESDKVVVSTKYKAYPDEVYKSKGYGDFENFPVVVLVDGMTASAGEIIALALRENGGATIVGSTTFGKGSIQTMEELQGGASLKFTIGKRYSPTGTNVNGIGVKPDEEIIFDTEEYKKTQADNQLEKAKTILFKKIK
ncbi:MAG TPA: S41 family peptidase, partial [Candidatus Absconditabacterales bacterium]|nr:S41 family peptidase [Candidatus Absconditabacterales bacterium]